MPPPPQYKAIQDAVFKAIDGPSFSASLPPLSEAAWLKILEASDLSRAQNDRLEFMGDALMYATLGRQLYRQIPEGTAGLYTETRAVLQANATFSRLAEKLDILAVSKKVLDALTIRTFGAGSNAPEKSRPEMKATGDLFETVVGAYYLERGFEPLSEWVGELFAPLIAAAKKAYLDHVSEKTRRRILARAAQGCVGFLTQKPRQSSGSQRRKRSHKQPSIVPKSPILSPIKARLLAITRSPLTRLASHATTPAPRRSATSRLPLDLRITTPGRPQLKANPIYIDLTGLSDDEDGVPPSSKKCSSQAQVASANMVKIPYISSGSTLAEDDDSADEIRLEHMLLSNNSDMDLASSDSD